METYRKNYLTWDEYFMSLVALSSLRSSFHQSGACIIDKDKRILSIGYDDIPYYIKNSDFYCCGNEQEFCTNALSNALYTFKGRNQEFIGSTIYLSEFPDCEQSRKISQARIKNVIYLNSGNKSFEAVSRRILDSSGIHIAPYFDNNYSTKDYIEFLTSLKEVIKKHIGKSDSKLLIDNEYFMGIAALSALRSKDPSTQVGACLVGPDDRIMSIGYNGAPHGMSDEELPWNSPGELTGDLLTTKDPYIVHAEINAFDNYRGNMQDFKNAKLYLIYSPCLECSKRIGYAELSRIIYLREYAKKKISRKSDKWLTISGATSELYNPNHNYTKEECIEFFDETTTVIKKYLKK